MNVIGVELPSSKQKFTKSYMLLLKTMRIIKYFGVGPLAGRPKYLAILYIFITLTAGAVALTVRFNLMKDQSIIIGKMAFGQGIFETLFSVYCLIYFSFFSKECKTQLVEAMHKLETKMGNSNTKYDENFHWVHTRMIIIFLYFLVTLLLKVYVSTISGRLDLLVILSTQIIALALSLQIFSYYLMITNWLRNKYDNCNLMTRSICEKSYRSKFIEKSDKIIKYLEISSYVVKLNNKLFGTSVFTSNCLFIYITLFMTVSIFDGRDWQNLTYIETIVKYVHPIAFLLYLMVFAMSCDAVEKSGRQVIKTCHLFVEDLNDADYKEQILLLARYAEQWCPLFSAAGFYDMNQSCLISIFSAIITYFVIIIQFNMVLTDD